MAILSVQRKIIKLYFKGTRLINIASIVGLRFDEVVDCIDAYLLQSAKYNQNYIPKENRQ